VSDRVIRGENGSDGMPDINRQHSTSKSDPMDQELREKLREIKEKIKEVRGRAKEVKKEIKTETNHNSVKVVNNNEKLEITLNGFPIANIKNEDPKTSSDKSDEKSGGE